MKKIKKQAILLLVHNNFEYVKLMLNLLDSPYFDFFIHVDASVKDYKLLNNLQFKNSSCYFVKNSERIDIHWGDFSIVEAELTLLKLSQKYGNYSYFHLLSGADFILTTPKQIFEFFDTSKVVEYVHFFNIQHSKATFYQNRYKYYYRFKYPKKRILINKLVFQVYIKLIQLFRINKRRGNGNLEYKVGSQWFSITSAYVDYILAHLDLIKELFKDSIVPDEGVFQTIIYMEDEFLNNLVKKSTEYSSIKREIQFINGKPKVWQLDDFEYLISSGSFFARKFDDSNSKELIVKIADYIRKEHQNGN